MCDFGLILRNRAYYITHWVVKCWAISLYLISHGTQSTLCSFRQTQIACVSQKADTGVCLIPPFPSTTIGWKWEWGIYEIVIYYNCCFVISAVSLFITFSLYWISSLMRRLLFTAVGCFAWLCTGYTRTSNFGKGSFLFLLWQFQKINIVFFVIDFILCFTITAVIVFFKFGYFMIIYIWNGVYYGNIVMLYIYSNRCLLLWLFVLIVQTNYLVLCIKAHVYKY